jgi:hypothetical protein
MAVNHTSIVERAGFLIDYFTSRLNAMHPDLLAAYPLQRYIGFLDAYPEIAPYDYTSQEVRQYCDSICRQGGLEALGTYHKLLLLTLIRRAQEQVKARKFPQDIESLYDDDFARIVRDIELEREPPGFYTYPKFYTEVALCTLRFIPAGSQKICLHGLPRRYFLRWKPINLLRAIRLLRELGGFAPIYEMHTDSHDLKAMLLFTRRGWIEFYGRVAALLERYPQVKGLKGDGWFFDPHLEHVSPELAYVRQLAVHNGATVLRLGRCDAKGIAQASLLSPVRRQLYLKGKYVPTNYAMVWPRQRLIAWARTQQ